MGGLKESDYSFVPHLKQPPELLTAQNNGDILKMENKVRVECVYAYSPGESFAEKNTHAQNSDAIAIARSRTTIQRTLFQRYSIIFCLSKKTTIMSKICNIDSYC